MNTVHNQGRFEPAAFGFTVSTTGKARRGLNKEYKAVMHKNSNGRLKGPDCRICLDDELGKEIIGRIGERVDVLVNPTTGAVCFTCGTSRKISRTGNNSSGYVVSVTALYSALGIYEEGPTPLNPSWIDDSRLDGNKSVLILARISA